MKAKTKKSRSRGHDGKILQGHATAWPFRRPAGINPLQRSFRPLHRMLATFGTIVEKFSGTTGKVMPDNFCSDMPRHVTATACHKGCRSNQGMTV